MRTRPLIFSNNAGKILAERTCARLSIEPGRARVGRFNDGEVDIQILENVRDADVFIIGPTNPPAENALEMRLLAEAAVGSSARRVTLVPTYLGYNRQDRKDRPRVAIASRTMIKALESTGARRFLLFDLHSEATMNAFDVRTQVDHLYASAAALTYLRKMVSRYPYVVASPDAGGVPRARALANLLDVELVIFLKERPKAGEIAEKSIRIVGEIHGKRVLFVDDMIDTAGTVCNEAKAALARGATGVDVFATHGHFSKDALLQLNTSGISEVVVTDTIPQVVGKILSSGNTQITVISIDQLLAKAINRLHAGESLSELIPRQPEYSAPTSEVERLRVENEKLKASLATLSAEKAHIEKKPDAPKKNGRRVSR